jgi:hypothetical protein
MLKKKLQKHKKSTSHSHFYEKRTICAVKNLLTYTQPKFRSCNYHVLFCSQNCEIHHRTQKTIHTQFSGFIPGITKADVCRTCTNVLTAVKGQASGGLQQGSNFLNSFVIVSLYLKFYMYLYDCFWFCPTC